MNPTLPSMIALRSAEASEARLGLRLAAALTEHQSQFLAADIESRLQFAREQALATARQARSTAPAPAPAVLGVRGGAALLAGAGDDAPWWMRLGSLLPLAVLLGGLMLIDQHYTRAQIEAAAEVDAAILADDLPPEAYRDQGFVEFLKSPRP